MTWKIYQRSAESEGPTSEEKTPVQEGKGSESGNPEAQGDTGGSDAAAPPQDPTAELRAQLASAKAEADQWRDRFLRKAAELDNFRKRTEKDRAESVLLAKSSVLVEFLPIVDACERALESFGEAQGVKVGLDQYREGVELLYKQMRDTLSRVGVVPIEARGQKFDPHLHEALMREPTTEQEENTVLRELRRGYLFKERLLRAAQVSVATHPDDAGPAKS